MRGPFRNTRSGTISADLLLSLYIALILSFVQLSGLSILKRYSFNETLQDETALLQLRKILLVSYDIEASSDTVVFMYQKRDMRLSLVNDHLIIQPGTQIFLSAIDSAHFETYGGCVYVVYSRNGRTYEKVLVRL